MAEQKGAPAETGAPHVHEYVAFRLLTIELADSNALAVLIDVTEVADADGLGNVGVFSYSFGFAVFGELCRRLKK